MCTAQDRKDLLTLKDLVLGFLKYGLYIIAHHLAVRSQSRKGLRQ